MVFSSLAFVYIFLPICFLLYFFVARNINQRNIILLVMSLIFYAWGEPKWIILMVISTLVEFIGAKIIDENRGTTKAKVALGVSVATSLSFLFIFKYFDFFAFNFANIFGLTPKLLELTLPIGISFYTFQTITYIVDVYKEKVPVQKSFATLLLYVSMFPQLIAGPIVKYSDIEEQLNNRKYHPKAVGEGVIRFLVGLAKKIILANIAGEMATKFLDGDLEMLSFCGAWIGIISYTLQIYFDFSAYSDMAIGLGRIFGFTYPENFNYPYIATTISDFWKRWHISLTTFFREYLYIPLGGNRKHHVLNLLIVWVLTGFWHGSAWNFILWGLYYYVLVCLERLFLERIIDNLPSFIGHFYTMFLVIIGWVFFYFEDMDRLRAFFPVLFGFGANSFIGVTDRAVFLNHIIFFIIAILAVTPISKVIKKKFVEFKSKSNTTETIGDVSLVLLTLFMLFIDTAAMVGSTFNPFLYFRF